MNLLFDGGCVWGFFEFIGALRYIKENNIQYDKLYGISSGAAIALCLLLDIDLIELACFAEQTVENAKFKPLDEIQFSGIEFALDKRPDAYKIANDRLYIGLTNGDGFYFKSKFKSNDDLANAIICGATIPMFSSYNSVCDDKITIDGGIGFVQNGLPKNTIVVHAITHFPISAIPPPKFLQSLLIQIGYLHMEQYIQQKHKIIIQNWYSAPELLPLWLYIQGLTNKITTTKHFRNK
jgi:hypothetical protein